MRVLFSRFSYQKLRQEVIFQQQEQDDENPPKPEPIRRSWFSRVRLRRQRLKIAGFRKLFKIKRVKVGRLSWCKVVKRFKESQAHFGDLFSGNYLFMQVSPASFNHKPYLAHHNHHHLNYPVNNNNNNNSNNKLPDFALSRSKTMFTGRVACPTMP